MNADVSVNGNRSIIDFEPHQGFCTEEAKSSVFSINMGLAACKTFNLLSSLQVKSPVLQSLKAAPDIFQRSLQKPQEEGVGRSLQKFSSPGMIMSTRGKSGCAQPQYTDVGLQSHFFICICQHCSPQWPSEWQKGISKSSPRGRKLSSLQAVTSF